MDLQPPHSISCSQTINIATTFKLFNLSRVAVVRHRTISGPAGHLYHPILKYRTMGLQPHLSASYHGCTPTSNDGQRYAFGFSGVELCRTMSLQQLERRMSLLNHLCHHKTTFRTNVRSISARLQRFVSSPSEDQVNCGARGLYSDIHDRATMLGSLAIWVRRQFPMLCRLP